MNAGYPISSQISDASRIRVLAKLTGPDSEKPENSSPTFD